MIGVDFKNNKYLKDFKLTVLFGILSAIFALIKFYVPGNENTLTDFREIPLLIGVYHLSNPLFSLGLAAFTALSVPDSVPFFQAFSSHALALFLFWFFIHYLKRIKTKIFISGLIYLGSVFFYYYILIVPISFLKNKLLVPDFNTDFINYYKNIVYAFRFEIVSTALITAIYIIQDKVRAELISHKKNLEITIKERTEALETANADLKSVNDELKSLNEELNVKNGIINVQNSELQATLDHLRKTQAILVQSEKMSSLGLLTAGIAHEINNPLNFIMGAYQGIQNFLEQTDCKNEEILMCLDSIKIGVERASGIVKGLNQFSRDNNTNDEDCNIQVILDNCLLMLQNQLKKGIEVIRQGEQAFITKGNVSKLHQVFINLLTNAIQSIANEGRIILSTSQEQQYIVIEITDNGTGISKENLLKITDPFFTTKEPGKGTGLGLSITYNIIKDHNGHLEFDSEPGKGTTARVKLPII